MLKLDSKALNDVAPKRKKELLDDLSNYFRRLGTNGPARKRTPKLVFDSANVTGDAAREVHGVTSLESGPNCWIDWSEIEMCTAGDQTHLCEVQHWACDDGSGYVIRVPIANA